ncbi:hypothetical protein ACVGVM_01730 [Pseudonocardia bannensis]|uniref:Uncharacterized protein n=1 Tax=Pseudonocardia bannensis TaxID=630973 RepID=A0A848DQT5_9PSEU|nr:hypothetical protein [Pseudonocardia bannensis]NMH94796.1 hypothetical protein [Pseudonocardia bannensis]
MQLAISPDVLVPLGAGAVALVIALSVVLTRSRRKRSGDTVDESPEAAKPATVAEAVTEREADGTPLSVQWERLLRPPAAADTSAGPEPYPSGATRSPSPADDTAAVPAPRATGDADRAVEPVESLAQPAPVEPASEQAPPFARPPAAGSTRTVADAVTQAFAIRAAAARRAGPAATFGAPDPAATRRAGPAADVTLGAPDPAAGDGGHTQDGAPARGTAAGDTTPAPENAGYAALAADIAAYAPGPATAGRGTPARGRDRDATSAPRTDRDAAPSPGREGDAAPTPGTDRDAAPTPGTDRDAAAPDVPGRAGSAGYAVARQSPDLTGRRAGAVRPAPWTGSSPAETASRRGDARDRLLAVLLDDPVRAVGATVELERCREQLDRLTDAVRHEREVLAAVLHRLSAAGLEFGQIVRLAGMPADEVRGLLDQPSTRSS